MPLTMRRSFDIAFLDLLPTHTMSTSSPLDDVCLAIESNVSEALAQYLPLKYQRWDDVRRQLQTLSKSAMWEWRQGQDCFILEISIEKLVGLETKHNLGDSQKEAALKYTVRVWEISMIRQMARDLTGKKDAELHRKIPIFARILSRQSVIPNIPLGGCEKQDEDFCKRREWLAALLKTYGEIFVKEPPVHDSELDAEVATIQQPSSQLQLKRLADESFSSFRILEAGPEESFDSTNPSGSTAPSGSSLTLTISGSTGSGYDNTVNSANTRENTKKSISGVSAGGSST
jgi:hypothetical protein